MCVPLQSIHHNGIRIRSFSEGLSLRSIWPHGIAGESNHSICLYNVWVQSVCSRGGGGHGLGRVGWRLRSRLGPGLELSQGQVIEIWYWLIFGLGVRVKTRLRFRLESTEMGYRKRYFLGLSFLCKKKHQGKNIRAAWCGSCWTVDFSSVKKNIIKSQIKFFWLKCI